jgi:hypothetical protein
MKKRRPKKMDKITLKIRDLTLLTLVYMTLKEILKNEREIDNLTEYLKADGRITGRRSESLNGMT